MSWTLKIRNRPLIGKNEERIFLMCYLHSHGNKDTVKANQGLGKLGY